MADPDPATFNLFPRLPSELRVQVWKEAAAAYIQDATKKLRDMESGFLDVDDILKIRDRSEFTVLIEPLPIMATCSEAREAAIRINLRPQPVRFLYVPPRVRSLKAESVIDEPIFLGTYHAEGAGCLRIDGGVFDSPHHLADVVGRYVGSDFSSIVFDWFAEKSGHSVFSPWVYWPEIPFSSNISTGLDLGGSSVSHHEPAAIPRVLDRQLSVDYPKYGSMVASVAKKESREDVRVSRLPWSVDRMDKVWMDELTNHMLQTTELLDTSLSHVRSVSTNVFWNTEEDGTLPDWIVFQTELEGDRFVGWFHEYQRS